MDKTLVISVGDIVLKVARQDQKGSSISKFVPKWEGPYNMRCLWSGYFLISSSDSDDLLAPINAKCLKHLAVYFKTIFTTPKSKTILFLLQFQLNCKYVTSVALLL